MKLGRRIMNQAITTFLPTIIISIVCYFTNFFEVLCTIDDKSTGWHIKLFSRFYWQQNKSSVLGIIHMWRPQNYRDFGPPPPLVRIWDWSTVLNSHNLPYYIFVRTSYMDAPLSDLSHMYFPFTYAYVHLHLYALAVPIRSNVSRHRVG